MYNGLFRILLGLGFPLGVLVLISWLFYCGGFDCLIGLVFYLVCVGRLVCFGCSDGGFYLVVFVNVAALQFFCVLVGLFGLFGGLISCGG